MKFTIFNLGLCYRLDGQSIKLLIYKVYDMKTELLNRIVQFFTNLYNDELDVMTSDCIYEWWYYNWSNWVEETNEDIYNEVEKAIWAEINHR